MTTKTLPEKLLPGVPLVESPLFDQFADRLFHEPELRDLAETLHTEGFAVIDFPDSDFDELADGIIHDFRGLYDWPGWRAGQRGALRVQNAWRYDARVRRLASNDTILAWLDRLYGRPAFPFQTITFPVGSQQAPHADDVHFNSVPEQFMCGLWIALEDMDEDNGPLFYYPGSHLWPRLRNAHIGARDDFLATPQDRHRRYGEIWDRLAEAKGVPRKLFTARKGQALLWSAGLVHGGMPIRNPARTRWSQVVHFFFQRCGYTYPVANEVFSHTPYLRPVYDVRTGQPVTNHLGDPPPRMPVPPAAQITPHNLARINNIMARSKGPDGVEGLPKAFNPRTYLLKNGDVLDMGVDPYRHFARNGRRENREW